MKTIRKDFLLDLSAFYAFLPVVGGVDSSGSGNSDKASGLWTSGLTTDITSESGLKDLSSSTSIISGESGHGHTNNILLC